MTILEAIKKYGLERQYKNCFGDDYPHKYIHYSGIKETPQTKYLYFVDNEFSADMDDGKTFIMTIQEISKTRFKKDGTPYMSGGVIELERE